MSRTKRACDCYECSVYCQCACHDQVPRDFTGQMEAVHQDVVGAFDHLFDLVHIKDAIMPSELKALCLTKKGEIEMVKFFEKRSYYPTNLGIVYDPMRGQNDR